MAIHVSDWEIGNRTISRDYGNGRRFGADIYIFKTHHDSAVSTWSYQVHRIERKHPEINEFLPDIDGEEPTFAEAMATADRIARDFIGAPAEVVYAHAL